MIMSRLAVLLVHLLLRRVVGPRVAIVAIIACERSKLNSIRHRSNAISNDSDLGLPRMRVM
jgi:hypothetical protein